MWLNKNNNEVIKKPKAVVVNEVTYPRNIFSKETELNAINIFKLEVDSVPNRRYYTYEDAIDTVANHITREAIDRPIADVQASMLKDLEATANSKFNEATSGYTAGEMASWNELEAEAKTHATTPLTSGMLFDEATVAGITVDELVTKVLTNAQAFKGVKSFIAGTRKKKELEILALTTVASCVAYEKEAYNYTITAEDVASDIEGSLVAGTVVIRYRNNTKDW